MNMHTLAQIIIPQSILVVSKVLYYRCLFSLFHRPMISHCSYITTITHSHTGHPTANLIQLETPQSNVTSARCKTNLRVPRRKMGVESSVKRAVDCPQKLKMTIFLYINNSALGQTKEIHVFSTLKYAQ